MKTSGIAALTAALVLCAAAARAQTESDPAAVPEESPYGHPYYEEVAQPETRPVAPEEVDQSRVDQDISTAKNEEDREIMTETPNRMEPWRVFPGQLPVKATTSGSLDINGRVLQDNRTNSAPPNGTVDPGSIDAVQD